jgi:hypothetical protein
MRQDIKEVRPVDRVKGFRNVQCNKKNMSFPFVKGLDNLLNIHETIMDASSFNEGCLIARDYVAKLRTLSISQNLGDQLCIALSKANRSEIRDILGARGHRDQHHISLI